MSSSFQQHADTPYQIINEGQEVTIKFDLKSQSTGVVTWNIPPKTAGCAADASPAYNGIVITLNTKPSTLETSPKNDQIYIADPTGDQNLHVGDKIGTSLVVGAFYDDRTTTSLDLTGLDPTKSYYISGYPVDNVKRYHTAGVHAYSMPYGEIKQDDKPATQVIRLGEVGVGVLPTDPTNLPLGETIELELLYGDGSNNKYTFTFTTDDIQTYQELVDEWNSQIQLMDSPLQSPSIPNIGQLYFKAATNELFKWNGVEHDKQYVIFDDTAPNSISVNDLWFNPSLQELSSWDGVNFNTEPLIKYHKNPTTDLTCDDFWVDIDDSRSYFRNDTVWVEVDYYDQTNDPSATPVLECPYYWFDESTDTLKKWDNKCNDWNDELAILWDTDPTVAVLDQYWFNDNINTLYQHDGTDWVEITDVTISSDQPASPSLDDIWYNPDDMVLSIYDGNLEQFVEVPVLIWEVDPLVPITGTLWWNETNDTLSIWDINLSSWVAIDNFTISEIDPSLPADLAIPSIWKDVDGNYNKWDGSEWVQFLPIVHSIDPTTLATVTYWLDLEGNIFNLDTNTIEDVIVSTMAPNMLTSGTYWYNEDTTDLHEFDGSTFNLVTYSNTPLTPSLGFKYYDTNLQQLRKWNGYGWVDAEPNFTVYFNDNNYLKLETRDTGSSALVEVGFTSDTKVTAKRSVLAVSDLFNNMSPPAYPYPSNYGYDGLESVPSYEQLGVGTDGSKDERVELIDSIRHQLGYPVIDVELTKQQMNYAIDGAIESIRKRSGMAYRHGYYFLDLEPRQQHYYLTNKKNGMNKIVDVMKIHRITSSFLAKSEGQGTYGQLALQHLYRMGSFDMVSYHMVSQYINELSHIMVHDIMFSWNEDNRRLSIFKDLHRGERVLIEVAVERTEQQIIKDRYLKSWIEKYAMVQCRIMLSSIRGKYANLPGAGGGTVLDSAEQSARADAELMELYEQLDDYIVNDPDGWGAGSTFIFD